MRTRTQRQVTRIAKRKHIIRIEMSEEFLRLSLAGHETRRETLIVFSHLCPLFDLNPSSFDRFKTHRGVLVPMLMSVEQVQVTARALRAGGYTVELTDIRTAVATGSLPVLNSQQPHLPAKD